MLGNILGRPTKAWKRREVLFVMVTCIWYVSRGVYRGPQPPWIRQFNNLFRHYAPSRIILITLTAMYILRHIDEISFLHSPDPPVHLYSPGYYRATWINTGLDAGFATAMKIRPTWIRNICSLLFSAYYLFHPDAADTKLRRLQQTCTLETLRVTWDKTDNPYLHFMANIRSPFVTIRRELQISRPADSKYTKPISAWLFYTGSTGELERTSDLILDFSGGGFIAMGPLHHEVRLRLWAFRTGRPILSVAYSKAPEYPYPYAIEEGFDLYRAIMDSNRNKLGMSREKLNVVFTGDSAGGNIATNIVLRILKADKKLQRPTGVVLSYPALNFAFTSWLWPHDSTAPTQTAHEKEQIMLPHSLKSINFHVGAFSAPNEASKSTHDTKDSITGAIHDQTTLSLFEKLQEANLGIGVTTDGSRMTMSSRAAFIHDRIINPSMMWAMAVMYLGQKWRPGLGTDYHVSPIMAPNELLAEFPPLLIQCGGNDPLVDDSVLFANAVQEAKANLRGNRLNNDPDVNLQIFPGWSHGYLQMSPIFPEARIAIDDIADWISKTFRNSSVLESESKGVSEVGENKAGKDVIVNGNV